MFCEVSKEDVDVLKQRMWILERKIELIGRGLGVKYSCPDDLGSPPFACDVQTAEVAALVSNHFNLLVEHLGVEFVRVPATKEKIIVSPKTTKATECEETQREAAKGV